MTSPSLTTRFRLEFLLVFLVALTLIAVSAEKYILKRVFVIDSNSGYAVHLYNDITAGGNSTAELIDPVNFEWRCELRGQYAYPFCGFEVLLDPERYQGVDLSRFDTIRLSLDYTGASETVRVYLRNFDPAYSRRGEDPSTKYNQIEFNTSLLKDSASFSLRDFFVANWWLLEYRIPPQLGHPQFDNVVVVEVQTGTSVGGGSNLGEHHFRLHRIEFEGRYLSTEEWYLCIMAVWLVLILTFLGYRIVKLSDEVRQQKRREQELLEINALLDMRSKQLEEKSRTDFLTGAFNRQGIEEAIKLGLWEWRSHSKPLSIVMMDIDHFKSINDNHGHAVGDQVLAQVTTLVQAYIRSDDLFARWGGEEFVLVCRNTRIGQAAAIAEKLRELIASSRFVQDLKVTVSMGVASLNANESLESLFKAADEALYAAKRSGRNRVHLAEGEWQQTDSPRAVNQS
jgi:diguanylate cyclase (GGDEF)-like protein